MNSDNTQNSNPSPNKRSKMKIFGGIILFIFFLLLIAFGLLQTERVQTAIIKKVTATYSEKLDRKITIKRIDVSLPDYLVLDDVYVEDLNYDTLAFISQLKLDNSSSILDMIRGVYKFEGVKVDGVNFNLTKRPAHFYTNLDLWLGKLLDKEIDPEFDKYQAELDETYPDSVQTSPSNFILDLEYVDFSNIRFLKNDSVQGQSMTIEVPNASFEIQDIDLDSNIIHFDKAEIDAPRVDLIDYDRNEALFLEILNKLYAIKDKQKAQLGRKPFLSILADELLINDGVFVYDNLRRSKNWELVQGKMNFDHFTFDKINFDINNFKTQDLEFFGKVNKFACREKAGFELDSWSADTVVVTREEAYGSDMEIRTNGSKLKGNLGFDFDCYTAWTNFPNEVTMDIDVFDADVIISDILVFAGNLIENPFFKKNRDKQIKIKGNFDGLVNQLEGNNLVLNLADQIELKGFFASNDLYVRENEYIFGEVEMLKTNFQNLNYFIPNFNPPANFRNLGNLDFSGNFTGFFNDFVSYGRLQTDLGVVKMDLQLNTQEGRDLATYQGKLVLEDFDIGGWTNNPKFGRISGNADIKNGRGLVLDRLYADFESTIERFEYNDYVYKSAVFDGIVNEKKIDGKFTINDPNIKVGLTGEIDFQKEIPSYDLSSKIYSLDLKNLNFSKRNLILKADLDLDLNFKSLADLEGKLLANKFLLEEGADRYRMRNLAIETTLDSLTGNRALSVESEELEGQVDGRFQLQEIPNLVNNLIIRKLDGFAKRFNLKDKKVETVDATFDGAFKVLDSKNWLKLIDKRLQNNLEAFVDFSFKRKRNYFNLTARTPLFTYGDEMFENVYIYNTISPAFSDVEVDIGKFIHNGKPFLGPLNLYSDLKSSSLNYELVVNDFSEILHDFKVEGSLEVDEDNTVIKLEPADLRLFDEAWTLGDKNKLVLSKAGIEVDNFELKSGSKSIYLYTKNNENLFLEMKQISLQYLDYFWQDKTLDLDGNLDVNLAINNFNKLEDLKVNATTDSFLINDDYWGPLNIKASTQSLKEPIVAEIAWLPLGGDIKTDLIIYPKKIAASDLPKNRKPGDLDLKVDVKGLPVDFAKYHLAGICSDFVGSVDGEMRVVGQGQDIDMSGFIDFEETAFNVNYLGTRYRLKNHRVKITENLFDATGAVLLDRFDNEAYVTGGMTHEGLKKLGLDASLKSDKFLGLETTNEQNSTFYGTGIGEASVVFQGYLTQPEMIVNAVTAKGTDIFIPIESGADDSEVSFVSFVYENEDLNTDTVVDRTLKGLDLTINLTLNENANMSLIFDERVGDVLKSTGYGDLQLDLNRAGDFKMYGSYEVAKGSYLFTYNNLYINKPFEVESGGTVRWNGDPFGAQLNLTAIYNTNTSLYLLLSDLLIGIDDERIRQDASSTTNVELKMNLTGELFSPTINFDLDFPFVSSLLAPFTENKLNRLRQNQGELNRQVFGLMVMGTFLPENSFGINNSILTTTVSQWLATQLSLYFSDLLTEIFQDLGFVNGVDFLVSYQDLSTVTNSDAALLNNRELSLQMKNYLFNNRVSLTFGGDIGFDNSGLVSQANKLTGGNVQLEYFLTEDRRLKLNIYSRFNDNYFDNARLKTGTGITYRKEFDTLREFFQRKNEFTGDIREQIKNE